MTVRSLQPAGESSRISQTIAEADREASRLRQVASDPSRIRFLSWPDRRRMDAREVGIPSPVQPSNAYGSNSMSVLTEPITDRSGR